MVRKSDTYFVNEKGIYNHNILYILQCNNKCLHSILTGSRYKINVQKTNGSGFTTVIYILIDLVNKSPNH